MEVTGTFISSFGERHAALKKDKEEKCIEANENSKETECVVNDARLWNIGKYPEGLPFKKTIQQRACSFESETSFRTISWL